MRALEPEIAGRIAAAPVNTLGEVTAVDPGGELAIDTEFGGLLARRAASCLLAPAPGDRVLVCGPDAGSAWVIAVLERRADRPARLVLDGDAEMDVRGSLRLHADQSLELASDTLRLRAREGSALIDRFHCFGRELAAAIGRLRLSGNLLETFVDRITQFARHSLRSVENVDQVRSGVIDYQAEQTLNLRGRQLLATAEELAKIDGGQIHLG